MVDEVPTGQLPQEGLLLIITGDTLQLLDLDVELLALNDIPAGVLAEVAGQRRSQEIGEAFGPFELHSDESLLAVTLLLALPILSVPPLLVPPLLPNEGMLDMLVLPEAPLAQDDILTVDALIDWLVRTDLPHLAPITVVVVLLTYLLMVHLLLPLVLLLFDLFYHLRWLLVTTQRTLHNTTLLQLMLSPLRKTLQVEGVLADSGAGAGGVTPHNLHMANRTQVFLILLVLLLDDDIPLPDTPHMLQELSDLVEMNSTIRNDVPQFLVSVGLLEEKTMLGW